jgi:hypothetical protein
VSLIQLADRLTVSPITHITAFSLLPFTRNGRSAPYAKARYDNGHLQCDLDFTDHNVDGLVAAHLIAYLTHMHPETTPCFRALKNVCKDAQSAIAKRTGQTMKDTALAIGMPRSFQLTVIAWSTLRDFLGWPPLHGLARGRLAAMSLTSPQHQASRTGRPAPAGPPLFLHIRLGPDRRPRLYFQWLALARPSAPPDQPPRRVLRPSTVEPFPPTAEL